MGEVYRARDTRLNRIVAIKIIHKHLADDIDSRQRFEREARAVSSLNHPHICTLYDIGEHDGINYLVMEHLEGQTLAGRLKKGPLPLEQTLRSGIEIADALDNAHRRGVIHRDLKPGNIILTDSGAKLLDFGLAKLKISGTDTAPSQLSALATASGEPLTAKGTILGTVQYMAPEQLEGKEADARTDVFAFGSVLYEMVTGRRPFQGQSSASLSASILTEEPRALSTLRPGTSPALEHAVRQCLAKNPDERWQTAGDLMRELRWIAASGAHKETESAARGKGRNIWLSTAVLLAAAVGIWIGYRYLGGGAGDTTVTHASLEIPLVPSFGAQGLSPDGTRLAFVSPSINGTSILCVRRLDRPEIQTLVGTEGATMPFWSPNSRFIGFFAGGKLKKINASGGPPQILCDAPSGRGGAWNRRDLILFSATYRGGLSQVSSEGGAPTPVTVLNQSRHDLSHRWPHFLPDGRRYVAAALFTDPAAGTETNALVAGELGSNETQILVADATNAAYVDPGYLLYSREGNLIAQRFDPDTLRFLGEPIPLAGQPAAFHKRWAYAEFSTSENGVLLTRSALRSPTPLEWMNRSGKPVGQVAEPAFFRTARISPDGKRIAVVRFEPRNDEGDIWIYDSTRSTTTRLTAHPAYYGSPIWSPDSSAIIFDSNMSGIQDVYRKRVNGSAAEQILHTPIWKRANDCSPDGRFVVYENQDPEIGWDLWLLPLFGKPTPFPILQTPFQEAAARFSPDGRWIAYQSDQSGRWEVYVQPFPGPGDKLQISRAGGQSPKWRGDGRELYFASSDQKLMAVDIRMSPTLNASVPRPLFDITQTTDYDVSKDGQRFLVIPDKSSSLVTLVINWTNELPR